MRPDLALAPVERTVDLRCSAEHAFEVFTSRIGTWWPLETHAVAHYEFPGRVAIDCRLEPREGGRFYEVQDDGSECDWGRIVRWDPPRHVAIDWNPSTERRPYTRIAVTFTPAGPVNCTVEVVHSGWDALLEGAEARAAYEGGWSGVLPQFVAVAEA